MFVSKTEILAGFLVALVVIVHGQGEIEQRKSKFKFLSNDSVAIRPVATHKKKMFITIIYITNTQLCTYKVRHYDWPGL